MDHETAEEIKRHFNVVAEGLRSEIRTIAEGFAATNERLDATNERLDATNERVDGILARMAEEFRDMRAMIRLMFGDLPMADPNAEGLEHFGTSGDGLFYGASLFVVLHAFASGGAAVTGVEAISDGVPAFRPPEWKNARKTLTVMGALLAIMFVGLSTLAGKMHVAPYEEGTPTVISEVGRLVFGDNPYGRPVLGTVALRNVGWHYLDQGSGEQTSLALAHLTLEDAGEVARLDGKGTLDGQPVGAKGEFGTLAQALEEDVDRLGDREVRLALRQDQRVGHLEHREAEGHDAPGEEASRDERDDDREHAADLPGAEVARGVFECDGRLLQPGGGRLRNHRTTGARHDPDTLDALRAERKQAR